MFLAKVYVTLKPTVNDPQGLTIKGGLHSLGFESVESVRAGKYMEIRVDAPNKADAEAAVNEDVPQAPGEPRDRGVPRRGRRSELTKHGGCRGEWRSPSAIAHQTSAGYSEVLEPGAEARRSHQREAASRLRHRCLHSNAVSHSARRSPIIHRTCGVISYLSKSSGATQATPVISSGSGLNSMEARRRACGKSRK